jgi:hypothetical protein
MEWKDSILIVITGFDANGILPCVSTSYVVPSVYVMYHCSAPLFFEEEDLNAQTLSFLISYSY